jgi:hypothetical protein
MRLKITTSVIMPVQPRIDFKKYMVYDKGVGGRSQLRDQIT